MSAPVDHPPPLCPSCMARMKQAVAEGKGGIEVCTDCQAREAARRKADGSPAPWWWSEPPGHETVLWDAAGDIVLACGNDDTIVLASEYVREAVRAAPEMEQLLRDYLALTARVFGHQEGHAYEDGSEVCLHCTNVAIRKRLDAARKAGG